MRTCIAWPSLVHASYQVNFPIISIYFPVPDTILFFSVFVFLATLTLLLNDRRHRYRNVNLFVINDGIYSTINNIWNIWMQTFTWWSLCARGTQQGGRHCRRRRHRQFIRKRYSGCDRYCSTYDGVSMCARGVRTCKWHWKRTHVGNDNNRFEQQQTAHASLTTNTVER